MSRAAPRRSESATVSTPTYMPGFAKRSSTTLMSADYGCASLLARPGSPRRSGHRPTTAHPLPRYRVERERSWMHDSSLASDDPVELGEVPRDDVVPMTSYPTIAPSLRGRAHRGLEHESQSTAAAGWRSTQLPILARDAMSCLSPSTKASATRTLVSWARRGPDARGVGASGPARRMPCPCLRVGSRHANN